AASRTLAGAGSASWLGERVPSPLDAVIFSAVVEPGSFAFLPDHLVHGRVVVAGSAHLVRALAAAQETTGGGPWRLEEIVFAQPLVLQAGQPRLAQLIWQPEGSGRSAVLVASAGAGDAQPAWMRHLTGYAVRADQSAAAESNTDLARLRGECQRFADPDTFYAELAERGYYFGPAFRWIEAVHQGEGQALCRLRAPTPVDVAAGTPLPPGLLDACLQSLSATIATAGLPVYVPYSVDRITFYGAPASPTWCHAVARDTLNGQEMVAGDVRLYDEAGRLVLEVVGLHGRPISAEDLRRAGTAAAPASNLFFQVQWPEASAAMPAAGPAGGVWLLLADGAGVAAALAKRLAANARTVVCVRPGDAFRRVGQGEWEMRPDEASDYRRLLAGVAESYGAAASEVVHLWSLEPGHADPLEAQRLGGESLILLIQAIAARAGPLPRVRAITAGAAPGYADSRSGTAWAAAALWGLGPVIAAEYPELWAGLVDIDPQDADVIAALWDALSTPAGEQRLVLRGRLRYAARLTAGTASSGARPAPPDIVPDATYLISGGLGALGMVVARWLVARGARHLVLLGRSAPDEPAAVAIAALAETGVQVAARTVDIAWPEQVEQLLAKVRTTMPPLRGVFHLAGVLEDATLAQVTVGQYRRVLAPKLAGAWNLHRLTLDDRLDYFVLFSSAAALLGPPGQAAYAGANAALDALAHVRRDSGLPALSINWGPWQGGGMIRGSSNHPRRWGLEPLAPDLALRALEQALALDLAQVAVMAWQPAALQPQALNAGGSSFLTELLPSPPAGEAGMAAAPRTRLAQAPAARRRGLLLEELQREAVRILGLPRSAVLDTQQPLNEYGLDSLMAVELRNAVVRLVGQAVPVTFLFDYPTLEAAANYLLATVFHLETEAPLPDETARPAGLERQIAGLSEAEAEARLAAALAALRAGDPQ
ncbi:MAG: SDR family NAD(P)-dependent oxidoreductase, partial [Anaerolineales bacterium]|nr:SDR family NAD(P)-dependent oxidoreductase [Anaerolineales bacterium]